MKWFYNMRISVKLITGFVFVSLIAGIMGMIGISNINKTDNNYTELYTNFGISMGDIGEVSTLYQRTRVNLRDLLLDKGSEDRSNYVNNIKEFDKKMAEKLIEFEKSIETEEAKKEYKNLMDSINTFKPIQEKIIDLALANQEEYGLSLMRGEGKALADEINNSIDRLFEQKVAGGIERSNKYSSETKSTITTMIIIVIIVMLVAVALGLYISRIISRPVKKLVGVAESIADGDLDVTIEESGKDEIGKLAFVFKQMADNLNDVMSNINSAAEQVSSGSKQVSESSIVLSQGATEQASSIEELTASIEEIASQTRQNADDANQANILAEDVKSNAVQGNVQMKDMLKAMDEINDSSGNISKIIKVIDEIAFQTNILALNAAVEAARAGQHGKGFAVVAEEVRNLAARSANAAKETTVMIEGSIKKVEGGTKIANDTAMALSSIVDGVAKVAYLVSNIAIASNEQALGISQINQGIMQVSEVVQLNSATSEESASASEELASQSQLLKDQVTRFKLRRGYRNASYRMYDDMNPDAFKTIEKVNDKEKSLTTNKFRTESRDTSSPKIILSDSEFGKY